MKRLFTLLLISFAALSCEMIDEKLDDQLDKRDWVVFAEGTELSVDVPSKQTVLNYHFESTLNWEVKTDAEWLEIDPMSGKAGKDIKIQIKVLHNKDKDGRTGYADLTLSNDESYRITINQAGEDDENDENENEGTIVDVPANQIWYTSVDGEIVEPYSGEYNEYAEAITTFGVNIVSNTYVDGKGVIEFEGDVTIIGDYAFLFCNTITTLSFPKSVTTIGDYAFYGCTSLTSVTIPDSVTTIEHAAFGGCENLKAVHITDLVSWCNIDFINPFTDGSIDLSANPLCYAKNLYLNGELVTDLVIPDGVNEIKLMAFALCESIKSVTIPNSVTTIGHGAFGGCENLEAVHITDLVSWCNIDFINLFTDGRVNLGANPLCNAHNLYLNGELVTDLVIPDGVNEIKLMAFALCESIKSVTIPDSVTTIGEWAFNNSSSLTSVTIGDSVTTIGHGAFYNCSSLTSVTIPDSVTTIGVCAFYNCSSLTSVTIGDSVTTIGDGTFYGCSSLTSVTIPDSVTTIGESVFYGCSSLTSATIGDSVTTIGRTAFLGCSSLTSVIIGDSVTTIGFQAFWDCNNLTSVTIPDSVTTIGYCAFAMCRSLTSVTIGDGVTTIDSEAFAFCSSLTSITIPDSVTTIGDEAFELCSSLTSVYCKAVTPPAGGSNMFYDNAWDRKIYVPMESVEAYKSASGWNSYKSSIVGYDF